MKQYSYLRKPWGEVLMAAALIVMLFLTRNTLVTTAIVGFNRAQFALAGIVCLLALGFLTSQRGQLREIFTDRRMVLAVVIGLCLVLPMVAKQDWQMMYFSILFCPLAAIFFTYFRDSRELARIYVAALAVIALYSIAATYFLRGLQETGVLSVPMFENSLQVRFYNFGLSFVSLDYVSNRNFGIFREPGVYQYFLMLGLFLNSCYIPWKREWVMWVINGILAAAMLTTLATGGMIELALFALFLFWEKKLYRKPLTWVVIALLAALGAWKLGEAVREHNTLYWELYAMFVSKFQPGEESWTDRIGSVLQNGAWFLQNPLVGGKIAQVLYAVENNTSSTMILYAILGILGGSIHVASWVALVWDRKRNILANGLLLAILFMSFNTQNLTADFFFWLFPTMALVEKGLPLWDKLQMRGKHHGA